MNAERETDDDLLLPQGNEPEPWPRLVERHRAMHAELREIEKESDERLRYWSEILKENT